MVSIIIPTYNRAHLLPRAINSVINQIVSDWELIIIDDGSTDNTQETVEKFLVDLRIRYFKKENTGAAHSRNIGVDYSRYEWITFLDSDDEADVTWLSKIVDLIDNNNPGVVSCGFERYDSSHQFIERGFPIDLAPMFSSIKGRFTNGGVYFVKKSIFNAVGGFDAELMAGQHTELSYRLVPYLLLNSIKIVNTDDALIKINIHEGQRIRTNYNAIFQGASRILMKHRQLLLRDKLKYIDYLRVAAVAAMRIKKYKEAQYFFSRLVAENPVSIKNVVSLIVSYIPFARNYMWSAK